MTVTTKRMLLDDPNSSLNKAADDEPVFLLRAQDKLAPAIVELWAEDLEVDHVKTYSRDAKIASAYAIAEAMRKWPTRKVPD